MNPLRRISLALAVIMLAALPVIAMAGPMIEGTVMATGSNNLFIVDNNGEHMEVVVPPGAKIMRDGQPSKLEEIQSRDQVSIAVSGTGQDRVATDVFARSPY